MAQLFRPGANSVARILLVALVAVPFAALALGLVVVRSSYATGEDRFVEQPVPFSHKHHVGDLRLDCRLCHTGVETQAHALLPPTKTCMTCHSQIWTNAEMLAPVRQSLATERPIAWSRVNRLPDYVYFDHHVHVRNGVPCAACHGALDEMPLTRAARPMTMQWCLDCHRTPERGIVPAAREFAPHPYDAPLSEVEARAIHARIAGLESGRLTDCSTCHR
jgi:hypothetical protein